MYLLEKLPSLQSIDSIETRAYGTNKDLVCKKRS